MASIYTLFSNRSLFWAVFYALGRATRLSLIYFSFFSLAACTIYLTGWVKSNDSERTDGLPLSYKISNGIFITFLCLMGLVFIYNMFPVIFSILLFASAVAILCNLRSLAKRDTSLMGLVVLIYFFSLPVFLLFSFMFSSFFGVILYSFAILLLYLGATNSIDFFNLSWVGSTVWLVGLAIFMFGVNIPALITDQMRLSSDGRFSYRIEIVDRGRNSEHVRLFTHEVETGNESTIILPELSGSLVMRDRERFGGFVLWEDDRYILFLDQRMWIGDTNWLAINEIDMSTESAVPFSMIDGGELFCLAYDLWLALYIQFINSYFWPEAWEWSTSSYPSFSEVIQAAEILGMLPDYSSNHTGFAHFLYDYFHRNNSGVSFLEFAGLSKDWW